MNRQRGALPIEENKKLYEAFEIDRKTTLVKGKDSTMYEAKNKSYANHPVLCRVYESGTGIKKDDMYLKFLRHLGKKHTSIVHTWDLFVDGSGNIEILQEYCSNGTLEKYIADNKLEEEEIAIYAWQLLRGMDFLGDIGIVHRQINPKSLVLRAANKFNVLKLSNFRKAIVYWSIEDNDIKYQPCIEASKMASEGESFQAPEVYGDPKKEGSGIYIANLFFYLYFYLEFDPVIADTFSFGAILYYMATKKYPFDPSKSTRPKEGGRGEFE